MPVRMRPIPLWLVLALSACSADPEAPCQDDRDCPSGRYCRPATGECAFDCTNDNQCGDDYICTARGRCEPGCHPTNGGVEACDGVDNDCDGQTDDLEARACVQENQHGRCEGTERCLEGAWQCDARLPAVESCDGADNDCDATTDEGLDIEPCPLQEGVCAGATRLCQGAGGWTACEYGWEYEPDAEISCDQLDNDCDGETDEGVEPLPDCESGAEAQDGIDNNCDGLADEPGGCMRKIPTRTAWIDVYENTVFENADCTGSRFGEQNYDYPAGWPQDDQNVTVTLYACSLPGLRPSRALTWRQARRACAAQGKYLCTKGEWSTACNGSAVTKFPYGHTYEPGTCNTFSNGVGDTVETGSEPGCVSELGCYDMSGNLWEWTEDTCEWDSGRKNVQGGSFYCQFCDGPNCVPCDMDNPAHEVEIEDQHGCQTLLDGWYCANTGAVDLSMGFRCCYRPP